MTPQEMEAAIARLFEGQDLLTGKVTELTDDVTALSNALKSMREEAEADRRFQREAIERMREAIEGTQLQADADRQLQRVAVEEMRTAVSTMLGIAESMASNVTLLT